MKNVGEKGTKSTTLKGSKHTKGLSTVIEEEHSKDSKMLCFTEDDLKYRMTRVSVEDIDLFLVETGVACNFQVSAPYQQANMFWSQVK